MVILLGNWKKRLFKISGWIIFFLFLIGFIAIVFKIFTNSTVFSGWFDDEHPRGNPMRVEEWLDGSKFNEGVESLVFKIQEIEEKNK